MKCNTCHSHMSHNHIIQRRSQKTLKQKYYIAQLQHISLIESIQYYDLKTLGLVNAQNCYKTSMWTDFGQGQGQPDIDRQYYYQSTTDGEHVTWKSCDIGQSSLEQSGRTQGLEGLGRVQRRVRVRDVVKGQEFLMVYTWCTHV